MGKFSNSKNQNPALSRNRKLYTCPNSTCPNRSHYTPTCPNITGKNPSPKPAATPPVEPSPKTFTNSHTQNLDVARAAEKVTNTLGGTFDRAAAIAVEKETELSPTVTEAGVKEWRNTKSMRHRDNDQPAVIHPDGKKEWWQNGKLHRSGDQPAIVWADGTQEWWWDGKLHRANDLPAVVWANGTQIWLQHDQQHRDNDQPAVVWKNGIQVWYWYDKQHRVLGPAFISPGTNGYQEWWVNDEETKHPDLCEQACAPARTSEEKTQLALLCLHDDPVVAAIAAHNPDCSEEGKTAYYLKHT